jgi:hypothetical protein
MQAILRPWITEIKTGGYRSRHLPLHGAAFAGRALSQVTLQATVIRLLAVT